MRLNSIYKSPGARRVGLVVVGLFLLKGVAWLVVPFVVFARSCSP